MAPVFTHALGKFGAHQFSARFQPPALIQTDNQTLYGLGPESAFLILN